MASGHQIRPAANAASIGGMSRTWRQIMVYIFESGARTRRAWGDYPNQLTTGQCLI